MTAADSLESSSDFVSTMLEEYGRVTARALSPYLAAREPRRHLHALMTDYPTRGGRMLRPSLCIATAQMLGAPLDATMPSAAAIELMHNAFLIHDDVEDESDLRRGAPALHALHGVPLAINAGDALSGLAIEALLDNRHVLGPDTALELASAAQQTIRTTVEGQAMELGWRRDNSMTVTEQDYFEMILKKTCAYTTMFPIQAGIIIAGADVSLDAGLRFAMLMGCAFQIQDDLLNLMGDEARYGKELNGDLYEGKRTLMLVHMIANADAAEQRRLQEILQADRAARQESDVLWMRDAMAAYGSLEYARAYANRLTGAAEQEFESAFETIEESPDKQFLARLSRWMIERT